MTDIIARLEALTGPDRRADQEIAKALGWTMWRSKHGYWEFSDPKGVKRASTFGLESEPKFCPETGKPNPHYDAEPLLADEAGLPEWTGSIDAAMSMVPDIDGSNKAAFLQSAMFQRHVGDIPDWKIPIALTIAALKARGIK